MLYNRRPVVPILKLVTKSTLPCKYLTHFWYTTEVGFSNESTRDLISSLGVYCSISKAWCRFLGLHKWNSAGVLLNKSQVS